MFRKMASVVVGASLVAGLWLSSGCAGNETGTSEGGGCTTADQCDTELICQPVTGRGGDFCCPAPLVYPGTGAFVSSQTNCQPTSSSYEPAPAPTK
jgi:hypothetical protein